MGEVSTYLGRHCRHGHRGLRYKRNDECVECKRARHRRWKRSEAGLEYNRQWAKKKYIPSSRKLLTPAERKERGRLSNLKSINRPGYKEKRRATAWRAHLRRTYGVSVDEFDAMAANGCNICGQPDDPKGKRLHVDHDHLTGSVRGVLCDPCNRGIGCFRDDADKITKAIVYLRRA